MSDTVTEVQGVKVGDFFVCSWGYDQTNIDFYKVVGLTAKCLKVQAWTSAYVGNPQAPQVGVVPGGGPVQGAWVRKPEGWSEYDKDVVAPVELKRVKSYDGAGHVAFNVNSFSNAYQWDGEPEYATGIGWGR